MLFNSIEFLFFFPTVFILYWFVANKNLKQQNLLLLLASYVFYGWWDWRFLFLLAFSTFLDYFLGLKIFEAKNRKIKKLWLLTSVFTNLGFLGFFKYYNFFIDSITTGLSTIGFTPHTWTLNIILPIGISFYTFHGLSYVFDIYNDKIQPCRNIINYSVFVSFFPLLVAGPIERATHLLPEVEKPRKFDYVNAIDGLRQILWGLFKKVAIADSCSVFVNNIFANHQYSGSTLALGAMLFAFQIYGDFSGYSDIAVGTARLLGFNLIRNFAFPYFSRDIAEFWRRWHISLTTWFRDYIYIPLGGSNGGVWLRIRNTLIIFTVSGLWHGANWTFIAWGLLNAVYFIPLLLFNQNRKHIDNVADKKILPSLKELSMILLTFSMTCFAWIFFRSESLTEAFNYISRMLIWPFINFQEFDNISQGLSLKIVFIKIGLLLIMEWLNRHKQHGLEIHHYPRVSRWSFYLFIGLVVLFSAQYHNPQEFIYFQF